MKKVAMQNLKTLALTNPGERIMDPNFGIGLKRKLFEQDSGVLRSDIKSRIIQQISTYIPYLRLLSVEFSEISNISNGINIFITYAISTAGSTTGPHEVIFDTGADDGARSPFPDIPMGGAVLELPTGTGPSAGPIFSGKTSPVAASSGPYAINPGAGFGWREPGTVDIIKIK